ncbi:nicotinate phosphoribosyltransferase [bacterium]|nr:nicotinate phosphoribosyltransferase [bacterium]QQR56898.1 MAG: nicotinate phosphoribosyltransferase [Candidatus Melainabacteria bacterium]
MSKEKISVQNKSNRQGLDAAQALLTDLYQITMAYAYWKSGKAKHQSVFTMSFRHNPFGGGFAIASGLSRVCEYLENLRFQKDDIDYLSEVPGPDGKPLFEREFLDFLACMKFDVDVDACPEGSVVFAHEPILRVRGDIVKTQILETALLNMLGFSTLVSTKAARLKLAARQMPVYEFGLRRAQGPDGALSASLASYIGGCDGTSNVLAGKLHGIPVIGTHAHSWVMSFTDELEAFETYAQVFPENCLLLVDTYDTINGVKLAIKVGQKLKEQGKKLMGVRLDSGDLAYLSVEARKLLNQAGMHDTKIVASNDLDEGIIDSLIYQGAAIDGWAVGTKLVTCYDQPALGIVYKLSALSESSNKDGEENWRYCVKLSEQQAKISNPGILQTRRFKSDGEFIADMVYDSARGEPETRTIVDPVDFTRRKKISSNTEYIDLLVPIMRDGKLIEQNTNVSLFQTRNYVSDQLASLHPGNKRLLNPHQYPVGLEKSLHELKTEIILQQRGLKS